MQPKLVLITGPSGAGKSVTAELVAAGWPGTCALLSHDEIRPNIKSGYAEPATDAVAVAREILLMAAT